MVQHHRNGIKATLTTPENSISKLANTILNV